MSDMILYTPIIISGELGIKNIALYGAQVKCDLYTVNNDETIKTEISVKAFDFEDAVKKIKKIIAESGTEDTIILEIPIDEIEVLQMKTSGRECEFYVYESWYIQKSGVIANYCDGAKFYDGLNVDDLIDDDAVTFDKPINSAEEFFIALQ